MRRIKPWIIIQNHLLVKGLAYTSIQEF